jgi:hypothetical protein
MIAFGTPIIDPEAYRRYAQPGIARAAEPESEVFAFAGVGSISRSCNLILDAAAALPDLEALVLVDQRAEIADAGLAAAVRMAFADPDVAVLGAIGARGVRGLAWWEGELTGGRVVQRYQQHGGGELPAHGWTSAGPAGEADAVDGRLLVLSPWAVRNVRFDESLSLGHGFDVDYCLQVRAAGRRVRTADLRVIWHEDALDLVRDYDIWVEAHLQLARKWGGRLPGEAPPAGSWKARARRAEAEREVARTMAYSTAIQIDARLVPLQRELDAMTAGRGWRATAPLRRANQLVRRLRERA